MNKNVGKTDKTIRIVLGLAIIGYGVYTQSLLGLIGLIPLGTALIGWCPLYPVCGITTVCKSDSADKK
ncbi:MAG: hypothetical protein B1H07_00770 [Campylobacteraceae bacterium 4484_166]|nr:MAG: hypothetical protein B1H07_00770 [Campylobacteraceae bacterium 4484_166]